MKKQLLLLLISAISLSAAASPLIVKLRGKQAINLENRTFYISNVQDERNGKTNEIGQLGAGKRKTIVILNQNPVKGFFEYYSRVFPKSEQANQPVVAKIIAIHCESKVKFFQVQARVTMELEFFTEEGNRVLLHGTFVETLYRPILYGRTFGKMIERILQQGMIRINQQL